MNQEIILLLFPVAAGFLIPLTHLRRGTKAGTGGAGTAARTGAVTGALNFSLAQLLVLLSFAAGAVYGAFLLPGLFTRPVSVVIANWLPPFGINLYFSPLTVGTAAVIYAVGFLVTLFDIRNSEKREPNYYLLYALMVFSSIGMVTTGDLFNLFVFLEIGGIASFACVGRGNRFFGAKGGITYLIQAQLLSLLMLAGIIFVYSASGVLNIGALAGGSGAFGSGLGTGAAGAGEAATAAGSSAGGGAGLSFNPAFGFLAGFLILLPFFLEIKLFPFNTWVSKAYQGASSSFAGSLSGIMALAGGVVLMRLMLTMMNPGGVFGSAGQNLSAVLIILGALTVIVGEVAALREQELKKVLGSSSIGQMGMIAVGIGAADLHSVQGAIFLLASHTAAKLLLFLVTGFFIRTAGTGEWSKMRGIARRVPLAGGLFVIGAMTLMGIPLFSGFWGKISILKGILQSGGIAIIGFAAILIGTIIEGIYFMRIGHGFFAGGDADGAEADAADAGTGAGETSGAAAGAAGPSGSAAGSESPGRAGVAADTQGGRPRRYSASFLIPALVLAVSVIAVGVYPKLIERWIDAGAEELTNPQQYIERTLPRGSGDFEGNTAGSGAAEGGES
jgi:formate hydrogenlyase subunit 3/multisubunit Na+/H+ antiporter MnhD subunit